MQTFRRLTWGMAGGLLLGTVYLGFGGLAMAWNEPLWVRQFGTAKLDFSNSVAVDRAGNIYLSGETDGSLGGPRNGDRDAWVAKYDPAGRKLWRRQLGSDNYDYATQLAVDAEDNVYVVGTTGGDMGGPNKGSWDAWMAKYDAAGTMLWIKQIGSANNDYGNSVSVDDDGNVYLGGEINNENRVDASRSNAFLSRYNDAGKLIWRREFGDARFDWVKKLVADNNGYIYVSGGSYESPDPSFPSWLSKHDSDGHILWRRQLAGGAEDLAVDAGGSIFLTGDGWVAKYETTGRLVWKRSFWFSSEFRDYMRGIAVDASGAIYVTGVDYSADADICVVKFDAAGGLLWKRRLGTEDWDWASDVAIDGVGSLYLTGATQGSLQGDNRGGYDAWVAKYSTR